jgi:hypothetical protein
MLYYEEKIPRPQPSKSSPISTLSLFLYRSFFVSSALRKYIDKKAFKKFPFVGTGLFTKVIKGETIRGCAESIKQIAGVKNQS